MISKVIKFIKMPYYEKKCMLRKLILMPLIGRQYRKFGKNSCILKELFIHGKKSIEIGDSVFIRNGARIEAISEWKGKKYYPRLVIGNRVSIEQNLHLICVDSVIIESDVVISSNVFISDNNHGYQKINENVMEQELEVKPVLIGRYSMIGTGAKIMAGVSLGKNVVIGANAVVTKDIPDYSIAVGIPAKVIKQYDFEIKEWVRK